MVSHGHVAFPVYMVLRIYRLHLFCVDTGIAWPSFGPQRVGLPSSTLGHLAFKRRNMFLIFKGLTLRILKTYLDLVSEGFL